MATWNSRGLRGSTLEDMINRTNEQYMEQGLALIQKIPTPITPINIDKESLIMEHNLSYKPIYELFQAKDNDNLIFTNYYNRENVEKVVIFQSRKDYCYNNLYQK